MKSKYGFDEMAIGDSFELDSTKTKITSFRVYAINVGKKLGKKFSVMNAKDRGVIICTRVQ